MVKAREGFWEIPLLCRWKNGLITCCQRKTNRRPARWRWAEEERNENLSRTPGSRCPPPLFSTFSYFKEVEVSPAVSVVDSLDAALAAARRHLGKKKRAKKKTLLEEEANLRACKMEMLFFVCTCAGNAYVVLAAVASNVLKLERNSETKKRKKARFAFKKSTFYSPWALTLK